MVVHFVILFAGGKPAYIKNSPCCPGHYVNCPTESEYTEHIQPNVAFKETNNDFNDPNRIVVVALEEIRGTQDEPVELWVQYHCAEMGSNGQLVTVPVPAISGLRFVCQFFNLFPLFIYQIIY
jgi:hypothetical protein